MHLQSTLRRPTPIQINQGCPRSRFWDLEYHESQPDFAPQSRILNLAHDSHSGNDLCGPDGAGLWQLSERVPEPLAGGRKYRQAAFALPPVRPDADVVGECAAGELAGSAGALPKLPGLDRMAVSAGGAGGGGSVGFASVALICRLLSA